MKTSALRRFAIEWLWALGCWLAGFLSTLVLAMASGSVLNFNGEVWIFIFLIPYIPVLIIRLTVWAIKTARKKEPT